MASIRGTSTPPERLAISENLRAVISELAHLPSALVEGYAEALSQLDSTTFATAVTLNGAANCLAKLNKSFSSLPTPGSPGSDWLASNMDVSRSAVDQAITDFRRLGLHVIKGEHEFSRDGKDPSPEHINEQLMMMYLQRACPVLAPLTAYAICHVLPNLTEKIQLQIAVRLPSRSRDVSP